MSNKVSVIMGSSSDLPIVEKAFSVLEDFGIEFEKRVMSAHRTPELVKEYVQSCQSQVFIAAAGGAAHLAGVIASFTIKPVIGIPITSKLNGLDSLLSTVQMPSGIPVASIAIDGAANAALLAIEILAINDKDLENKLLEFRKKNAHQIKNTVI